MPVLVLHGQEDFLIEKQVAKLKGKLVKPGMEAFNFAQYDNPDIRVVSEAALTLPFGDGNRMVLIANCTLFTRNRAGSGSASNRSGAFELKEFEEALLAVSEHTYLVFACPHNFDKTLKISKTVSKFSELRAFQRAKTFPGSYQTQHENFCREEANSQGATIDDQAIWYLLDSTEADLRQIAGEIKKAAVYILPDTHISLQTVSLVSQQHSHVFTLLDHVACGRKADSIKCLDELLSRVSAIPLMATLNTTVSRWVRIKALAHEYNSQLPAAPGIMRRQLPDKELSKRIAVELKVHPWGVEMDLKRLKGLSLEYLIEKRMQLTRLESSVKSGDMLDKHALLVFVTDW